MVSEMWEGGQQMPRVFICISHSESRVGDMLVTCLPSKSWVWHHVEPDMLAHACKVTL